MVAPAGKSVAKVSKELLSPSLILNVWLSPPTVTVKSPPAPLMVLPEIKVG